MSPRAACRLEQLGFTDVFDFVDGKSYWLASGLSTEGTQADLPRAGNAADTRVPTCRPHDTIATATAAIAASGWDQCIVTDEGGIVAGRLRASHLDGDPTRRAEDVMELGPTTIRPDTALDDILARMTERDTKSIIVTTPTGLLVGVLRRR